MRTGIRAGTQGPWRGRIEPVFPSRAGHRVDVAEATGRGRACSAASDRSRSQSGRRLRDSRKRARFLRAARESDRAL